MRIVVPVKQVVDPDHTKGLLVSCDKTTLDRSRIPKIPNPFDEYALEAALRLTEDGRNPKVRLGQVVAMTVGDAATESVLRSALAIGADRAKRIDAVDDAVDGAIVSKLIARIAQDELADLVVLGKQTVDGDGNEVAQRVAGILEWPQVTCATSIEESSDGTLRIEREVDGGVLTLSVKLPAVVSVDLRIVAPEAVRSCRTPRDFLYAEGVRYAPLPAIIAAKRKAISLHGLGEYLTTTDLTVRHVSYELAEARGACKMCSSVHDLVHALRHEARLSW